MVSAASHNALLESMMDTLVGDRIDVGLAEKAFKATRGDFRAKFAAALEVQMARLAVPEVVVEIPEHPDQLSKADLDELVRPAAIGFLRSHPTKGELLEQVASIQRRERERPAWVPLVDRDGNPVPSGQAPDDAMPDRTLKITSLPEIGEVVVKLPVADQDRPELEMAPGGIGEWEAALHSVLGLAGDGAADTVITLDAAANEALVPEESRWWPSERSGPVRASEDPGVASELLATTATLGGISVLDTTSEDCMPVVDALLSAEDWRHSPQWLMEAWVPGDGTATLAVARAAIAGWSDGHRSGVVVFVHGGALHPVEGLLGDPVPLHGYVLVVTRATDGTDQVGSVHRLTWSCPGEHWCHRGGCPDHEVPEVAALLMPIVTAAAAAEAVGSGYDAERVESYLALYGEVWNDDTDRVVDQTSWMLADAGWVELEQSTWEGGLEHLVLRRAEHCLRVAYDPVTKQLELADGKRELDLTLQILAEEGVLVDDDTGERIVVDETTLDQWGADLLRAADDRLHGRFADLTPLTTPVQVTVLGLHPHGDGNLHGPDSVALVQQQLEALFTAVGLTAPDSPA
ncbi:MULTISPECIES: hypothetical protein [unclassified Saccharothrix]|uniref:hypothetical protein n=1 Tax=unclassified Saccharothrix TaxID=2593673 RepID=UPI00307F1965